MRYADAHEMLDTVRPDVLHIVTVPHLRVELMSLAAAHEVPAVIVEKPIALEGEDFRALREPEATPSTRVCVKTQLNFPARNL